MKFFIVIFAFAIAFGLLYFFFWVNAIRHAIQNEYLGSGEKLAWILAMIFFPFFGVIFYWALSEKPEVGSERSYRESDLV